MFETMHIKKNVKIMVNIGSKERQRKIVKICNDIQEANHAMKDAIQLNINGDQINITSLPWLLMEKQSNAINEVI